MTVLPYLPIASMALPGGDLLQQQEQRRGARLEHVADLVLQLLVNADLGQLAHKGAHAAAEDRDEEQQAEQEPQNIPQVAPTRPGGGLVWT